MTKPIQIVDLFAGPGGLGEGFSSIRNSDGSRQFRTLVSVERDPAAHRTLTLRAFYRLLHDSGLGMSAYYDYLQGGEHPSERTDVQPLWNQAREEALCLELGSEDGNRVLENRLREKLTGLDNWVLIGGPPCQAYSVVGRVRNRGNKDYRPEEDNRHFLYREYLDVIAKFQPAVFVMENVRGMLTSRVGKERIFGQILEDLHDPTTATGHEGPGSPISGRDGYTLFSLEDDRVYFPRATRLFGSPEPLEENEYNSFVIKAEDHGIPQARHRVILVGVRNDIVSRVGAPTMATFLQMPKTEEKPTVERVLSALPALRSGLSRGDSEEAWYATIRKVAKRVAEELLQHHSEHISQGLRERIAEELQEIARTPHEGLGRRHDPMIRPGLVGPTTDLDKWYHGSQDQHMGGRWYNHEARSHMEEDLARYLYCAAFSRVVGRSPTGNREIYLDYLAPMHANWKSGKFADRFKVVLRNQPSKTVTSHISKDGHYFIHYDPRQCRSLTVREAARLQTFPDDYYFEGNRTEQYVQVGNAVPPLLARRIAVQVMEILEQAEEKDQTMRA